MPNDNTLRESALADLHAATCALGNGRLITAVRETLDATNCMFALFKHDVGSDSEEYNAGWTEFAKRLSRLPPSVVREAARIIAEED